MPLSCAREIRLISNSNRVDGVIASTALCSSFAEEFDELRNRLAAILAVEERQTPDWLEVERLASQLQRELPIGSTPEAGHRYLDDADNRSRDDAYGVRQRREVRRYVDLAEYNDSTPFRGGDALWSFLLAQA